MSLGTSRSPFFPLTHINHHTGTGNSHRLLPLVSSPHPPIPLRRHPPSLLPFFCPRSTPKHKRVSSIVFCTTARLSCCPPSSPQVANQGPSSAGTELFACTSSPSCTPRGRKRVVRTASEAIGVNWVRPRLAVADWSKRHWAAAPCRPGAAQLARIRATTQIPDSTWLSPPWVVPTSPADGLHEGTTTATDGPPTTSLLLPPSRSSTYARPPPPPLPPPPRVPDRQTDHHRRVHCRYAPSPVRPPSPPVLSAAATAARSATSAT